MTLTVLVDITVAVEVGVVMGALLFMKKMTRNTKISRSKLLHDDEHAHHVKDSELILQKHVPSDVVIYEVNGPLFFGISETLHQKFNTLEPKPRAFIFRINKAPLIDASGLYALQEVAASCKKHDITFLISGIQEEHYKLFQKTLKDTHLCPTLHDALSLLQEDKIN
jgi:SulP family sulfate permease